MRKFKNFNAEFNKQFGFVEKKYPYAGMILDQLLRKEVAGKNEFAKTTANFLLKKTAYSSSFSWLLKILIRFSCKKSRNIWVGKLERFQLLKKKIAEVAETKGYGVVSSNKVGLSKEKHKSYHKYNYIALSGPLLMLCLLYCRHKGAIKFSESKFRLKLLNSVGEKKCSGIEKLLRRSNINMMIELDDQMPDKRIMAQACKNIGIKYYVFAHGYFLDPFAISVLPVRGDKLFLWSHAQDALVKEQTNNQECSENFGLPYLDRYTFKTLNENNTNDVLVVFPYIGSSVSFAPIIQHLDSLHKKNISFVIKLHQKNYKDEGQFLKKGFDCIPSNVELDYKRLLNYTTVIGGASSVLFQAFCYGLNVYQVEEWSSHEITEVEKQSFCSVLKILCQEKANRQDVSLVSSFDDAISWKLFRDKS